MPKVKIEVQKEQKLLKGNIMKHKAMNDVSVNEMAILLGLSNACIYQRLRNPDEFRVKELRKLAKRFHISFLDFFSES